MSDPTVRYSGKYAELRESADGWEYVVRPNARGCVAVLAITRDKRVVLIEQYRPPVDRKVIELPAGLAGDIPLQEDEPLETAARRELKEETGYEAKHWDKIAEGPSSAGLTNEFVTIFHASKLTKVGEGGGTRGENIRVHLVDIHDVAKWSADRQAEAMLVDHKIFAALYHFENGAGRRGKLWF